MSESFQRHVQSVCLALSIAVLPFAVEQEQAAAACGRVDDARNALYGSLLRALRHRLDQVQCLLLHASTVAPVVSVHS